MSSEGGVPPSAMAAAAHEPSHVGFGNLGGAAHYFRYMCKRIGYGHVDRRALDVVGGKCSVVEKFQ